MAEKKKILIVEDDPNFGSILKDYLKLHSYDVTLAKNGIEGLEKFKKIGYDLCILDVMMPFKDGFSLATDIRLSNEEIPLIFLTAKSLKEDVIKGFKIGADDYLIKPFVDIVFYQSNLIVLYHPLRETSLIVYDILPFRQTIFLIMLVVIHLYLSYTLHRL